MQTFAFVTNEKMYEKIVIKCKIILSLQRNYLRSAYRNEHNNIN